MSPRVIVVPSRIADVYRLAAHLRAEDRAEMEALYVDARTALRVSYRNAILRRTYFVDGEIAAMVGMCGGMIDIVGRPYLVTTPAAARAPVAFVKEARKAVAEMLKLRELLVGEVLASYARACGMLELIGFALSEPHPLGPKQALFRTFSLQRPQ